MKLRKKDLTIAVSSALLLGSSALMPVWSQDDSPDTDVPEFEGAEVDIVIPENVARDADGYEYPAGGPNGLYRSITDKQAKSGETVKVVDSVPEVTPGDGNYGHQVALEKQRRNLERKLEKDGIEYGGPSDAEIQPVVEAAAVDGGEGEIPEGGIPDQETELEAEVVVLPELTDDELSDLSRVAHDSDGKPYEEGGPKGLYKAVEDKQAKLGDRVVQNDDGTLGVEEGTGGNGGLKKALVQLRTNLERKLKKAGLFDDGETPEVQPIDDVTTQTATLDSRTRGKSGKQEKVSTSNKPQKQERVASTEKSGRSDRADLFESGVTRGKPARVEKLQKPVKVQRVEKPQKPVKVTRVEKPQRVERVSKPEKFSKPEKPNKPGRPK